MATNYESIDMVRALSQNEVNKLTNPQLKKALMTAISTERDEEPSNNELLRELRVIKEQLNEINTVREEVRCLSVKLDSAYQVIHQQQLFLESIDNRERRRNLVITGLSETADDVGADDLKKLRTVLTKAKCPDNINPSTFVLRRLGQPNQTRGLRPLHVTVDTPQQREAIIM